MQKIKPIISGSFAKILIYFPYLLQACHEDIKDPNLIRKCKCKNFVSGKDLLGLIKCLWERSLKFCSRFACTFSHQEPANGNRHCRKTRGKRSHPEWPEEISHPPEGCHPCRASCQRAPSPLRSLLSQAWPTEN